MTCNDTGYQAISFDEETHLPKVNENLFKGLRCFKVKKYSFIHIPVIKINDLYNPVSSRTRLFLNSYVSIPIRIGY